MKTFKEFLSESMFANTVEKNLSRGEIQDLPVGTNFYHNGYTAKKVSDSKVEIKSPMSPASRVPISSLREATQPEWRVSFKKQKMNGVAVDDKPVTVKARDSREAILKAAKKVGVSDKSVAMQMKTKSIDKLDESLTEAKYEVEVEVRDARAANDLAKDMFRGSYKNDGSNVFIFKNEDDYEEFKDELEAAGLKLM